MSCACNHRSGRNGRSLKLFLVDGSPTGLITAELGNWSGKAVVAPRTALPNLIKREEASRTGVYLLRGADLDNNFQMQVYVGESDNVKTRLINHDSDDTKQFFTHVCLIVSKDENLTKSHVRYLEARIIELVDKASRADLVNGRKPVPQGLPEPDVSDMEGFLSEICVLLPMLGFDVLRETTGRTEAQTSGKSPEPVFVFSESGTKAKAIEAEGEFVVLAKSIARVRETKSIDEGTRKRRARLVKNRVLVKSENGEHYIFKRNAAFPSSSSAASVVYGGSMGGPMNWKRESDGLTYKKWREERLAEAQNGKE